MRRAYAAKDTEQHQQRDEPAHTVPVVGDVWGSPGGGGGRHLRTGGTHGTSERFESFNVILRLARGF